MKNALSLVVALVLIFNSYGQTAREFNERGVSKFYLRDYRGAIADYTKAIELDPKFSEAYNNRAYSKKAS